MNTERLTLQDRAARYAALGDASRLAVVDELVLGDRSPSELQVSLGLPSNLMAHHLKVLEDAGVVIRRPSEGDRRRTYLTLADDSVRDLADIQPKSITRIVFVCSANSARSQLAAALWTQASDVPVKSAGTHPAERIADGAQDIAKRRSLRLVSDAPEQFAASPDGRDFVVAVCDNAYEELGSAVSLHWSIPDPVAQGDQAAFDHAYAELDRRISTLAPRLIAS